MQPADAISEITLGILRGSVKPSGIRGQTLFQGGNRLAARFADMPMIEADSSAYFGPGKEIDADGKHLRKALQDWAKSKFPQGTTLENADQGWNVQVTPAGIKSSLHHGYDELLARSVPFIPHIIEGGMYLDSMEKKPGLVSHIFANKIRLDGQDYVVGFVLREDRTGNRFYDHELTEIINPDWLKPGRDTSEEALGHRTNRGDVMHILRNKLGVNDGTGRILFQSAYHGSPRREGITRKPDSATARVVSIPENAVPEFSGMKDFANWLKDMLAEGGNVTILSTRQEARFSSGNVKASVKRSRSKEHRNAYAALREMVENAEYDHYEAPDERHPDRGGQDVYHSALAMGGKLYSVKLKLDVVTEEQKASERGKGKYAGEDIRYKDHKLTEIEIAPAQDRGFTQIGKAAHGTDAISEITLGILRGSVKPSGIRGQTLFQPLNQGVDLDAPVAVVEVAPRFAGQNPKVLRKRFPEDLRRAVLAEFESPEGVVNADMGKRVGMSATDFHEHLKFSDADTVGGLAQLEAVSALPDLMRTAKLVESYEDRKGTGSIKEMHRFQAALRIGDKDYSVKLTVKEYKDGSLELDSKTPFKIYHHRLEKEMPAGNSTALSQSDQPPQPSAGIHAYSLRALLEDVKDSEGQAFFQRGPAVVVRGDELGVPKGASVKEYQKAAREVYRGLQKTPAHRDDIGDIHFTKAGWSEAAHTGADARKWKLFPKLKELIENAEYIERHTLTKQRKDDIVAFHWLESDVELAGEQLRVGLQIAEDSRGNKFYNINQDLEGWRKKYKAPGVEPAESSTGPQGLSEALGESQNHKSGGQELHQDAQASHIFNIATPPDGVNLHILERQGGTAAARASITFVAEAKGIIRFFQSADVSSAGHEIGHSLRRVLELGADMDHAPGFVRQDWETACAFVGAEPGQAWTVAQEEKFADAFVDYLQRGKAPSAGLRRAFTRLARWLTDLYRRIRRLDVRVSPEMARVFDRLLATEQEMNAAKQRDGLEYMSTGLEDVPPEFLGGDEAKVLAEAVARADLDAQAAIHDKLVRELRRNRTEWRKQARDFAATDPEHKQLDALIAQGGLVLSDERKARYGKEIWTAIRGKRVGQAVFSRDGNGLDAEMAADMWGFAGPSAVDDFMAHLAELPTKKELQRQYMRDSFRKWRNGWTSDEVILTDGAARMLELEEVALARAAGGQFQSEEALRRKVTEEVLKLEIGQVEKNLEALKTAARENSEAVRAIYRAKLKDKAAQALELKRRQRRAVAEIRERYQAKELRRKGVERVRRMARAKVDVMDYVWLEQLRSVANRFGLGGRRGSVRTPERLQPLPEFLARVQADFDTPVPVPDWLASVPARGMDWRRLNVEQFGELVDFITWMDHQGREAKKLTVAGQKLDLTEALNSMTASLNSLKNKAAIADYEKKKLGWKAVANLGRKYLAGITQFEYVFKAADGYRRGAAEMEGPHVKYIVRPLYEARSAEMAMLHEAGTALNEILKPFRDKAGIARSKARWAMPDVSLPEDVKKRWGALPWTYERVLMVALNMGNDGNLAALKGGFGWKDADLRRITAGLTAEDWTMVQNIWDYIDSLYPQLDAAYQAVNGLPMKKVKPRRIQTKFGMLKGGYFPLIFDGELSDRAAQQQETDAMMNGAAALIRAVKPSDGFTMDRKGDKLPPKLSLSVLNRHIQDSCHYATHAPVIHNIRKITQNKGYRGTLEDKFGKEVLNQLQPWLNNIARPQRQELTGIEQFVEWGRQMATIQALGLKFTTAMMQLTSISASAQEIGYKAVGEGLSFIAHNRSEAYRTIQALSPMMRDRVRTINTDLARSMDRLNPDRRSLAWNFGGETYEVAWDDVQRAVFAPMTLCDSIVAYSTWWGAYRKALRETEGDQKAAVVYADRTVALAQSSDNAVNLSILQQATGYKKLLTMFMTYTMNLQNRIRFQTRGLMEGQISPVQYMEYLFNDVAAPALSAMMLKALLSGGDVPDEPEDYLKELGYYMLSGFPIVRDMQSLYEYGGDISVVNSSISRGFSAPFMAAQAAYTWWTADTPKEEDAALFSLIKHTGESAGFALGVPPRPIFQFFQGASDIANGKTHNPFALFVRQK